MRVRLRTPVGQVVLNADEGVTHAVLAQLIEEKASIPASRQQLLVGYPPAKMAEDHRLTDGETIIVHDTGEQKDLQPAPVAPAASLPAVPSSAPIGSAALSDGVAVRKAPAAPAASLLAVPSSAPIGSAAASDGVAVRKVIPADNNCLFASLIHCLQLSVPPQALREVVERCVLDDPIKYSEGILGMAPARYAAWITGKDHWGGEIELQILSKHFRKQIAAFDIVSGQVFRYGEEEGFEELVALLYDGIHYDAIIVLPTAGAPEEFGTSVFSSADKEVVALAQKLQAEAHAARQFTDTAKFTLRCLVCQAGLVGEKGAQEHAKATGHVNFSEY
jgi:ubiquitin thioesterase OTU1